MPLRASFRFKRTERGGGVGISTRLLMFYAYEVVLSHSQVVKSTLKKNTDNKIFPGFLQCPHSKRQLFSILLFIVLSFPISIQCTCRPHFALWETFDVETGGRSLLTLKKLTALFCQDKCCNCGGSPCFKNTANLKPADPKSPTPGEQSRRKSNTRNFDSEFFPNLHTVEENSKTKGSYLIEFRKNSSISQKLSKLSLFLKEERFSPKQPSNYRP
ncbi:hypothetical protein NPIL_486431 [Nephila pilipes]|uniref:Uncharacterized protein n=1 Tax=Nephila pilipes TaxID=299642 RepID=A0A8X6QF51_NEPPI|nr:hypothetical protein NPIL_486431 [Nephila pilipes]